MPATEETYRRPSTLHIVFGLSSILMTASIVWMILADHLRPWKQVQRQFHQIEDAKLRASETQRADELEARSQTELDAIDAQIKRAQALQEQNAAAIRETQAEIDGTLGEYERLDTERRFQKAELDSQRSFYDGMIDRNEIDEAYRYLATVIRSGEERYEKITLEYEDVVANLARANAEMADLKGHVGDLESKRDDLRREFERARRLREQKESQYFGPLAWMRGLPLIDLAAPPVKIQQISLPELTINYNFKEVPRYDRCTTCHLGIDKLDYKTGADGKPLPSVFASHPKLTEGATAIDPKGNVVQAGLYLDSNGPHPINSFGCTICHDGQGSGTDFTYASHTPSDLKEEHRWVEEYDWREMHHWDYPMLTSRFDQSSCLKCHDQVTDIPQAEKLQAGYERIVTYGCTGCHTIGGEGAVGPDLTDARQVGPNLAHLASKSSEDWTRKWIKNPHAFRPDSRMPRFYGVSNNDHAADWPKNHAEIHAITAYLWAKSTPPEGFVDPPDEGDADRGKDLFFQKWCMACHAHKDYAPGTMPAEGALGVAVGTFAEADYGPSLSNVAAKFQSNEQGFQWLANWIKAPEAYHPKSLMPNLQLSWQEAADIASWILSVPAEWPEPIEVPALDTAEVREGLDDLVALYKSKTEPLSRVPEVVAAMSTEQKLLFVGEKTIGRLGCFGCHNIPGFQDYKPIGTPLNGWGLKSPTKLEFAHIAEFLQDKPEEEIDPYYEEQLLGHKRAGFLYEKLHRPRSYDYRKTKSELKAWDERLRMPQFAWADDPAAIEEVMTFVLGLTGERINDQYVPHYDPKTLAIAKGEKLLNRYNCVGCHTLAMPTYTLAEGTKLEDAIPEIETSVVVAYRNRGNDYRELYPDLPYDADAEPPKLGPTTGEPITIEGMPVAVDEEFVTVQLWRPATIRGFTFNIGDNLTLARDKVAVTPPVGGDFAWLYASAKAEETGDDFGSLWNRLPPPLLREGDKVRTGWLTGFLQDPYPIRPAVNLRMPRFHYGQTAEETRDLANYFAAKDGAPFPYQDIPERERAYLASMEGQHPDYLAAGWNTMTKGACVQCHAIGPYKPTGGAQVVNGPDLRQVYDRFRPDYLTAWLARPSRLLPYTAMPQNIPPHGQAPQYVPETFEGKPFDQVKAMRDALLNYLSAVEGQLAAGQEGMQQAEEPKAGGDE